MRPNFQIIEDNGGNLYAFLFNARDQVIKGFKNLEYLSHKDFMAAFNALKTGSDAADWEGSLNKPAKIYEDLTDHEYGWKVVASNKEIYPAKMGAAARLAFGIADD